MKKRQSFMYLRLSSEDEAVSERMRDESNSIANQRALLRSYIQNHPDLGSDFEEIMDDGYSGTSFQRPGMKRLLSLVEADEVDVILVKDLSRFGRNYLEAGYYIELVFPVHCTRLIAVNDRYDSRERLNTAGDIDLALNNLKNEFYSRDCSMKMKSSLDAQRRSGQFSGRVPFGYLHGPTKRDIVVDEKAAQVVRHIFHLAADLHMCTSQIARQLNGEGVLSPSLYRRERCGYRGRIQPIWMVSTVYQVLTNRIYTGSFEMYKRHVNGVGMTKMTVVPRREREIISNTHQPIVSEAVFLEAQKVILSKKGARKATAYRRRPKPMLAKYLKCGCCGVRLSRPVCTEPIYRCRTASIQENGPCKSVACDAVALEQVVFQAIRNLIELADIEQEQRQSALGQLQQRIGAVKRQIHALSMKNRECNEEKISLYEQLQSGQIDREAFSAFKHEADQRLKLNRAEIEALTEQLSALSVELEAVESEQQPQLPALDGIDRLTPALLEAFVSRVVIHRGGEPEIVFRVKGLSGGQC